MSFHALSLVMAIVNHACTVAHTHQVLQHAWSHVSRQTIMQLTCARKKASHFCCL